MFRNYLNENSWGLKDETYQGYQVKINDKNSHDLKARIAERTDLSFEEAKAKIQKGFTHILKKIKRKFIKDEPTFVELKYLKSNFKAVFFVNTLKTKIELKSILSMDMISKKTLLWTLNEFVEEFPEFSSGIDQNALNENVGFYHIDKLFDVEINLAENDYEFFISDEDRILQMEIPE